MQWLHVQSLKRIKRSRDFSGRPKQKFFLKSFQVVTQAGAELLLPCCFLLGLISVLKDIKYEMQKFA